MSGRPAFLVTDEFVTKSDHQILRMWRLHCMWKACNLLPSAVAFVGYFSCVNCVGPCVSSVKKKHRRCIFSALFVGFSEIVSRHWQVF